MTPNANAHQALAGRNLTQLAEIWGTVGTSTQPDLRPSMVLSMLSQVRQPQPLLKFLTVSRADSLLHFVYTPCSWPRTSPRWCARRPAATWRCW